MSSFALWLWPLAPLRLALQSAGLAVSQIWVNKTRSALTTIGIVIAVASVTAVIAALTSLRTKVLADFEAMGTRKVYLSGRFPETGRFRHASWRTIEVKPYEVESIPIYCPSVDKVACTGNFEADVRAGSVSAKMEVYATQPAWLEMENRAVLMGRPFSLMDELHGRNVCIITPETRDHFRLNRDCIGETLFINNRGFTVIGLLEPRVEWTMIQDQFSNLQVFIPFSAGQKLGSLWTLAAAASKTTQLNAEAQAEIRFYMRHRRHLRPDEPDTFHISTVEEQRQAFDKEARTLTMVAGGIVSISLLVGGIGIMNIMLVSVSERTREIGLRKAVGATPLAVLSQFLIEAVILCLLGAFIGLFAGQVITRGLAAIPNARLDQAYIPFWAIAVSFSFSASVGLVFGIFPAIKAARLDPIEALRHE